MSLALNTLALVVKYVSTYTKGTLRKKKKKKKRSAKDSSYDAYGIFFVFLFSDFLYKSICCGYLLIELHQQVNAVQMDIHNICLYKEVDKKYIWRL